MGDGSEREPGGQRGRVRSDERGAAMVEFALVAPLLFMLLSGMFSGGVTYNRKLAVTNGVREGSRYAATLSVAQAPPSGCANQMTCWLAQVATVTQQAAEGELGSSASSSQICVAYVYPDGAATSASDSNRKLVRTSTGDTVTAAAGAPTSANTCFLDGRPNDERRVQVTAQRDGKLEFLVSSPTVTLRSQSVTRFEAIPS